MNIKLVLISFPITLLMTSFGFGNPITMQIQNDSSCEVSYINFNGDSTWKFPTQPPSTAVIQPGNNINFTFDAEPNSTYVVNYYGLPYSNDEVGIGMTFNENGKTPGVSCSYLGNSNISCKTKTLHVNDSFLVTISGAGTCQTSKVK